LLITGCCKQANRTGSWPHQILGGAVELLVLGRQGLHVLGEPLLQGSLLRLQLLQLLADLLFARAG
jgi:hypothetical protein